MTKTFVKINSLFSIANGQNKAVLSNEDKDRVHKSFCFLEKFCSNKLIYGINTGLGPMTKYRIEDNDTLSLQYNLIRSHSSGFGNPLPPLLVKASMLARLNSLTRGFSGVHPEVVEMLVNLINNDIIPFIPEHGGVGASGDLVQLAHLALVMIGEGEVYFGGARRPAAEVFAECGLKPVSLHIREGLSLINGTSVMTGIGIVNLFYARRLLDWATAASALLSEIVQSYDDYFSDELNRVKPHAGQNLIARNMRKILSTSGLIRRREEHLYSRKIEDSFLEDSVQEYYSIRCVPQILGAVEDALENAARTVIDEYESVNDNPVVDYVSGNVYHGGNFHGDYVSFEMDKLKIAMTKLSLLSERHINFLMNSRLNGKLPPFVNLGTLGLNLGLQGVQFSAVSTAAENQTLSFPMSLHTIPNNNDNQDIVSMGTNSALMAKRVIDNSYEVITVEFLSLLQAVDYLKCFDRLSDTSRGIFSEMRKVFPVFVADVPHYVKLDDLKDYIRSNSPDIDEGFIE